jgi:hypothetical protein
MPLHVDGVYQVTGILKQFPIMLFCLPVLGNFQV